MLHSSPASTRWIEGKCGVLMKELEAITAHTEAQAGHTGPKDSGADGHHRIPATPALRMLATSRRPLSYAHLLRSATASTTDAPLPRSAPARSWRTTARPNNGRPATALAASAEWCCVVSPMQKPVLLTFPSPEDKRRFLSRCKRLHDVPHLDAGRRPDPRSA
eukprot:jgi/Mesvir1/27091/Mv20776-RA.1